MSFQEQTGQTEPLNESYYHRRVVLKFYDYVELPYVDEVENYIRETGIGPWDKLAEKFPGITIRRFYTTLEPEQIQQMVRYATEMDPTYQPPNLLTYFVVVVPPEVDPESLAEAFRQWETVEMAYVESKPVPLPLVNYANDPLTGNQSYLNPAPLGIDAKYAWNFNGSDGANMRFVDLEKGWALNHQDLAAAGILLISGVNKEEFNHGTAVLGIVIAQDNTIGCVGIAPRATTRVVSGWQTATNWEISNAILSALPNLAFGDVLLLEVQVQPAVPGPYLPAEKQMGEFDTIRLAAALGIVVIEPAANAPQGSVGINVDNYPTPNRAGQDSGAIMVGASASTVSVSGGISVHNRLSTSNYGSRVDCYGWGELVFTLSTNGTGTNTTSYNVFSGTSSASAIVAGAALVVQGMAEQSALHRRFNPRQLRYLLKNNGTPSGKYVAADPANPIGFMPNLRQIIDNNVLNLAPDVYIRDFVGDNGDPHTGSISSSPDIIVRPNPVANPQATFGHLSGTENSNTLGSQAEAGQNNYVYVRVLNRGGTAVSNVTATVYWSPVSTLVRPDLWSLVGSTVIPSVPTGNILTVSNAIIWSTVPATGHYCFVGLIGHPMDPAPTPADFQNNFTYFYDYIRRNNNVTWRNFNVVDNTPNGQGVNLLPFLVTGPWHEPQRMSLEVETMLPEEAVIWLEGPRYWMEMLVERHHILEPGSDDHLARLRLNPHGCSQLAEVLFPAEFKEEMAFVVLIPEASRGNAYELSIQQIFEQQEVGRITWRLSPPNQLAYKIKRRKIQPV